MKFFIWCLAFTVTAWAVPDNQVYPNSGSTDAKVDQQTDIMEFSRSPTNQGTGVQEQQESPPNMDKPFAIGPYDADGNYSPKFKKSEVDLTD